MRSGFGTREQRESKAEERDESRVVDAESAGGSEKGLVGGEKRWQLINVNISTESQLWSKYCFQ